MMKTLLLTLALAGRTHGVLQVAKGGGMCAGYDDAGDNPKIYYGACDSADTVTTSGKPYFTVEMVGMGVITGTDTAYLTESSQATMMDPIGVPYKESDVYVPSGAGSTYAYIAATTGVGDGKFTAATGESGAGAYFGTAFYLFQTGSLTSNTNTFPAPNEEATHEIEVCIVPIVDGVCGAARTWSAGDLKFSIYGAVGGDELATQIDGKSYLGFRTQISL